MKLLTQIASAALALVLTSGLLAGGSSTEVDIKLLREDISEWMLAEDDALYLQLIQPARTSLDAELLTAPPGTLFSIYLHDTKLISFKWYGEDEPSSIAVPASEAAIQALQYLED